MSTLLQMRHVDRMGQSNLQPAQYEPSDLVWRISNTVRRMRLSGLLIRTMVIGFITLTISGTGHILLNPVRDESSEAAELVSAITDDERRVASMGEDLISELGYEPLASAGRLVKPLGGCSTPVPLGPDAFEDACRTHDLGYDLLRYAEERGQRLGPWARFELDRRLYRDLLERCRRLSCRTAATTYYTAVTTNSVRQGYGAPTDEPATPWVGVGLLVVCFALLSDPRGGLRSMIGGMTTETLERFPIDRVPMAPGSLPGSRVWSRSARSRAITPSVMATDPSTLRICQS